MRWEREHPEVMKATADFVRLFENEPDPVVAVSGKAETLEARIAWTLFGSALAQEISPCLLQKTLDSLFERFPGERLWSFPLAMEAEIRKAVRRAKKTFAWSLEESVPGIFWSAGNFVRRRSPLAGWASSSSIRGILRDLGEIFFMGKGAYRPKAILAVSRMFSPPPRGLGVLRTDFPGDVHPVPFALGARRWIGFVGPGQEIRYREMDETKKRHLGVTLARALSPEDPWKAAHALQFFCEPSPNGMICSLRTDSCQRCPLSSFCPRSLQDGGKCQPGTLR